MDFLLFIANRWCFCFPLCRERSEGLRSRATLVAEQLPGVQQCGCRGAGTLSHGANECEKKTRTRQAAEDLLGQTYLGLCGPAISLLLNCHQAGGASNSWADSARFLRAKPANCFKPRTSISGVLLPCLQISVPELGAALSVCPPLASTSPAGTGGPGHPHLPSLGFAEDTDLWSLSHQK